MIENTPARSFASSCDSRTTRTRCGAVALTRDGHLASYASLARFGANLFRREKEQTQISRSGELLATG